MTHDAEQERRQTQRRRDAALEARVAELEVRLAISEERVKALMADMNRRYDALLLTMNSRYGEIDASIKLVFERLDRLFAVKERIVGAFALASFLGIAGIVGGVITVIRAIQKTP